MDSPFNNTWVSGDCTHERLSVEVVLRYGSYVQFELQVLLWCVLTERMAAWVNWNT